MRAALLVLLLAVPGFAFEQKWTGGTTSRVFGRAGNRIIVLLDAAGTTPAGYARAIGRYRCRPGTLPCWLRIAEASVIVTQAGHVVGQFENARGRNCQIDGAISDPTAPVGAVVRGTYFCETAGQRHVDAGKFRVRRRR